MAEKKESKSTAKSAECMDKPAKAGNCITKDIKINSLVRDYPESISVLMQKGFHCIGCVAAQFETLEQGAAAHGIDIDELVKEINKAISEAGKHGSAGKAGAKRK